MDKNTMLILAAVAVGLYLYSKQTPAVVAAPAPGYNPVAPSPYAPAPVGPAYEDPAKWGALIAGLGSAVAGIVGATNQ